MLNSFILLIYHAVSTLRRTGINFIASVSGALLLSGSLRVQSASLITNEKSREISTSLGTYKPSLSINSYDLHIYFYMIQHTYWYIIRRLWNLLISHWQEQQVLCKVICKVPCHHPSWQKMRTHLLYMLAVQCPLHADKSNHSAAGTLHPHDTDTWWHHIPH